MQEFGLTRIQILGAVALLVTGLVTLATGFHLAIEGVDVRHDAGVVRDRERTTTPDPHTRRSAVRKPHPVLAALALARLLMAGELRRREASSGGQPGPREWAAELLRGRPPGREAAHRGLRHRSSRRWWEQMIAVAPERIFEE
ncbi:MAG: hypothetical protein ACE5JN_01345 [Candidatus Methylomirabilia bacterium]